MTPNAKAPATKSNQGQAVFFRLNQRNEAEALVRQWHYSGRFPSANVLIGTWHTIGGLFGDMGPAIATCVIGHPPARWAEEVLELTRLVRADGADCPPLSGLISACVRWVRRKALGDLVVSYADATESHHGGIYQAASWKYDGQREPRMDGVIVRGRFVPGRQANNEWGTQSPAKLAEMLGVDVVGHWDAGKHLYWRALNSSGRRKARALGLADNPYPKPEAQLNG